MWCDHPTSDVLGVVLVGRGYSINYYVPTCAHKHNTEHVTGRLVWHLTNGEAVIDTYHPYMSRKLWHTVLAFIHSRCCSS